MQTITINNNSKKRPGTMADACNPALWEGEAVYHLRSGVQDQPGQHGQTQSLLKIKIFLQEG